MLTIFPIFAIIYPHYRKALVMKQFVNFVTNDKRCRYIFVSSVAVTVTTVAVYLSDPAIIRWLRMIWNYFLAVIPLCMAMLCEHYCRQGRKAPGAVCALVWLLFFPNSIYMATDLKYCATYTLEQWGGYQFPGADISIWLLVFNLLVSIFCGVLSGLISLEIIHNLLREKLSGNVCLVIITLISVISSFGIYIGRFARLNSWDILNPPKLFGDIARVMTSFAPAYILIFTVMTLTFYAGYKFLKGIIKE